MMDQTEHFFECPYCGETISMLFDLMEKEAKYIEDCEVCCQPIEVSFVSENEVLQSFQAQSIT